MNVIARALQTEATLYGTMVSSDAVSCLQWTSQAAACASHHVGLSDAFWAQDSWFPTLNSAPMALRTTQGKRRAAGQPASSAATP